jgi:hypothetical protein
VMIWGLALLGLVIGLRERQQVALMALSLLPIALLLFMYERMSYLFILPLAMLGGLGLLWGWENVVNSTGQQKRMTTLVAGSILVLLWAGSVALFIHPDTLSTTPFSSDELAALDWYRRNTPTDITIANEWDEVWVPIVTERTSRFTPYTRYASYGEDVQLGGVWGYGYTMYRGEGEDTAANDPNMELVFQSGEVRVYQLKEDES